MVLYPNIILIGLYALGYFLSIVDLFPNHYATERDRANQEQLYSKYQHHLPRGGNLLVLGMNCSAPNSTLVPWLRAMRPHVVSVSRDTSCPGFIENPMFLTPLLAKQDV